MGPKNTDQRRCRYIFAYLCAVIHEIWIAAFFNSINFEHFLHLPPGRNESLSLRAPVTDTGALFYAYF